MQQVFPLQPSQPVKKFYVHNGWLAAVNNFSYIEAGGKPAASQQAAGPLPCLVRDITMVSNSGGNIVGNIIYKFSYASMAEKGSYCIGIDFLYPMASSSRFFSHHMYEY